MTPSVKTAATLYLWRQRTLYLGHIGRLSSLSQGAHTLLLGLDEEIPLTVSGQHFRARSYLIPAGVTFSADSRGKRIACCFLDPLGKDLLFHAPAMTAHKSGIFLNSSRQAIQLQTLHELYREEADAGRAYSVLEDRLFPAQNTNVEGFEPDERIAAVVEQIRSDPAENLSNEALAEQVGLSGDRLQRLFKQATGIPIRRYRLWHRLFVTSSMMAMGSTLTDAALAAGFSDSSHLTHVFKSMLGMSPSAVLRRSRHVRILVGGDG
ncbi:MAG: AraC family transcriptional regulator [Pseudomonadales bacterium]|nr:AraC family transcriptional regulator [Pseudomonadales bacterium]